MKTPGKPSVEFGRQLIQASEVLTKMFKRYIGVEEIHRVIRPAVSEGVRTAELAIWRESVRMAEGVRA